MSTTTSPNDQVDLSAVRLACLARSGTLDPILARRRIADLIAAVGVAREVACEGWRARRSVDGIEADADFIDELGQRLSILVYRRIVETCWGSSLDLGRVAEGSSVCGWARQLTRAARRRTAVTMAAQRSDVWTEAAPPEDSGVRVASIAPWALADDPTTVAPAEVATSIFVGLTAAKAQIGRPAAAMVALTRAGAPWVWPAPSHTRAWAAGVGSSISAVHSARVKLLAHRGGPVVEGPCLVLTQGWSRNDTAAFAAMSDEMTLAWLWCAATARVGPPRRIRATITDALLTASRADIAPTEATIRRLGTVICAAMAGASRPARNGGDAIVASDADIGSSWARLVNLAGVVAGLPGAPLGSTPGVVIATTTSVALDAWAASSTANPLAVSA